MILVIGLLLIAGIIYYSSHKIPPDPLFQKEVVYVEEKDFWQENFNPVDAVEKALSKDMQKGSRSNGFKLPNAQKIRAREKTVQRRRKRNKIAKKSRQKNRR